MLRASFSSVSLGRNNMDVEVGYSRVRNGCAHPDRSHTWSPRPRRNSTIFNWLVALFVPAVQLDVIYQYYKINNQQKAVLAQVQILQFRTDFSKKVNRIPHAYLRIFQINLQWSFNTKFYMDEFSDHTDFRNSEVEKVVERFGRLRLGLTIIDLKLDLKYTFLKHSTPTWTEMPEFSIYALRVGSHFGRNQTDESRRPHSETQHSIFWDSGTKLMSDSSRNIMHNRCITIKTLLRFTAEL